MTETFPKGYEAAAQNLLLPICPRCNDTQFVTELTDFNGLQYKCKHGCSQCDIEWHGPIVRNRQFSYAIIGSPCYYDPNRGKYNWR